MAIERFNKVQFEDELPGEWSCIGIVDGEYTYVLTPPDAPAGYGIRVRSSIGASGIADEAGEDSIRAVVCTLPDAAPFGGKSVRWISRVKGWQGRLSASLAALRSQVARLKPCPHCAAPLVPLTVKKAGPNKGRPFISCMAPACKNYFEWTDIPAPVVGATPAPAAKSGDDRATDYVCCQCNSPMVKMGTGKGIRCGAPGNSWKRDHWSVCNTSAFNNKLEAEEKAGRIRKAGAPAPAPAFDADELSEGDDGDDSTPAPVVQAPARSTVITAPVKPAAPVATPAPLAAGFPADGPRPIRTVKRVDPETSRLVAALKDSAAMVNGGAVDADATLAAALRAHGVDTLVATLAAMFAKHPA